MLVNGATGAIGSAAVQILRHFKCNITAVANTKNITLVRSLGAEKVYNYEKENFTISANDDVKENGNYRFIFDAVGKSSFPACKHLLTEKGTYISTELGPNAQNLYLPLFTKIGGGKRVKFPIPVKRQRSIDFLSTLVQKGEFRGIVDREYSIDEIIAAYEYVLTGEKTGNVIVTYFQ